MEMNFTISERLTLMGLLPAESDIVTMRVISDLRKDLGFTEDEIERYQIIVEEKSVKFIVTDETTIVNVGNKAKEIITTALNKLNDEKKVTANHLSLFEKFEID